MPADRLHLVRHGEVFNPGRVLYGRLPHFHLSELGEQMAATAADELASLDRKISNIHASPLLRTQQSAAPIAERFNLDLVTDDRLIEPYNIFEGRKLGAKHILIRPHLYYHVRNPYKPTWGEAFLEIVARMTAAMDEIHESTKSGDAVLVTHQLPIVMVHRSVNGLPLPHNPRKRRCALSSITSFEKHDGKWAEVGYVDPAAHLASIDRGAV